MQKSTWVKVYNEKICSARHNKRTRPGIETLLSVREVNRIICGGYTAKTISAFFALLNLTYDLSVGHMISTTPP